ncbi:MAG TPA: MFS transporter [Xanthobacteraceae bacterium]|jgi:predicted MFS family arabinose efflux permease|nr:MFS transporter [Xanthobacteraceae bacterium]
MAFDTRSFAIATAGFSAFVNLYSPQALLPKLAEEFGVGAGAISSLITASTLAIALSAPFTGALADVVGRKRLITAAMFVITIPTVIMTFSASVPEMVMWRFIQGLLVPPIFTVTVAYIGDEWPAADVTRIAGLYMVGASVGGFSGRFIPGILTDFIGWRGAFDVVAFVTLVAAVVVALLLPREKNFVASDGLLASARQMARHLRNPRLIATFAVGFGVLFNFVDTFTYVNFHLAAPPYLFPPTLLGLLFLTYLASSAAVPFVSRGVTLFGRRPFVLGIIAVWIVGALIMLAPPVTLILAGLTLCAVCGMMCQTVSTGYVTLTAKEGRSSAVGLYASIYYIGGSAGAFLPGFAWEYAGWVGCVATLVVMQLLIAAVVALAWE